MIAKAVARRSATSGFGRLTTYITDQGKLTRDERFARTAAYIARLGAGEGQAVGVRVTNCWALDLGSALHEIQATQALNTRSEADKTYHLVFSFPEGERPSPEVLSAIEQALCDAIGLGEHQRISAVHDDTPYLHVHVAINKVHPETLKCVSPHRDHPKLMAACRSLEQAHGLTPTPHGLSGDRRPGGARDMEAQAQRESLAGWLKPHLAQLLADVAEAQTWQDAHAAFAALGLVLKPRGAGLVVVSGDVRLKASRVDRSLSLKALSARFGAYEPPGPEIGVTAPRARYTAGPHPAPGGEQAGPAPVQALFERWQAARRADEAARRQAQAAARTEWDAHAEALKAYHGRRAATVRDLPTGRRQPEWARLRHEKRRDWASVRAGRRAALAAARRQHPQQDWRSWLEREAAQGDAEALSQLARYDRTRAQAAAAVLRAPDAGAAARVVYADLRPRADRRGHLHYDLRDGGRVVDSGRAVEIRRESAAAAYLALSLSRDRHPGQAIVVEGGTAFRSALARAAALPGLDVRFVDVGMERLRQAEATARGAAAPSDGIADYIAGRNALRSQVSTIPHHRAWVAGDAGPLVYGGRRRARDGTTAVLWTVGGEVLVQRCSAAQFRLAGRFSVGERVDVTAHGRWGRGDRDPSADGPAR